MKRPTGRCGARKTRAASSNVHGRRSPSPAISMRIVSQSAARWSSSMRIARAGARPSAASVARNCDERLLRSCARRQCERVQVDLALARRRRRGRRIPAPPRRRPSRALAAMQPIARPTRSGSPRRRSSARQRSARGDRRQQRGVRGRRRRAAPAARRSRRAPGLRAASRAANVDRSGFRHRRAQTVADVADAALFSFFIRSTTRQSAHILQPVERARRREHRMAGELRQHVADHLLGAERLAAARCS